MTLQNFKRHNLDEEIYEQLRAGILNGDFQPGERLVELRLADKLGVSRTPLREALRRLEAEGLVKALPQGGLAVSEPDAAEIEELFGVREVLEAYAARLAAEKAGTQELALIKERHAALDDLSKVERSNDFNGMLVAHNRLHQAIVAASGNQTLYRMVLDLQERLARYDAAVLREDPDEWRRNSEGHHFLLEALYEHNAEALEQMMRDHVHGCKVMALELLTRKAE
jgi:DNA-binding GntR family transcriptional regulator